MIIVHLLFISQFFYIDNVIFWGFPSGWPSQNLSFPSREMPSGKRLPQETYNETTQKIITLARYLSIIAYIHHYTVSIQA